MKNLRSLHNIRTAIQSGEMTMVGVVTKYLESIDKQKDLNIFVEVYTNEVLEKAALLDKKIKEQPKLLGKLWGVVVSLKDVIAYKDHKMTAGSKILQNYIPPYNATVTERMLAEDAIVIGRVNCDEFAMGSSNEKSYYGVTHNSLAPDLVPGGSSGASASSVQADTCLVSLGSDTGGSVRQPAAFCGVVGMKPTYGRISRHGLIAYASSFDQIGVLGHNIADIALINEVICGADEYDATISQKEVPAFSQELKDTGVKKIAIFESAIKNDNLDPEIKKASEDFIKELETKGHSIDYIGFDYFDYVIPAYYVMTTAEASSNLARFDGIRYGHRTSETVNSLTDVYNKSRTEGFGEEVQARILLGTYVLSAGYYDAYFTKAQKVRRIIFEELKKVLQKYDFIGLPTSPTPAWKIGALNDDPVQNYLADIFTVIANMGGFPALSLPIGQHTNGSGIGFQFISNKYEESELFAFSNLLDKVSI